MSSDIEDLSWFCTLFYNEKRDKEALETLKQLIDADPKFDKQRRILFQAIYKQIIDALRRSLLNIKSYYETNTEIGQTARAEMLRQKKDELIDSLLPLCKEAISYIDDPLLPNAENVQMAVYLHKFKGDLYRYIAEYSDETDSDSAANNAEAAYQLALDTASSNLPKTDPVYLSLILNSAVFKYEIRKERDVATDMLKGALVEIPDITEDMPHELTEEIKEAESVIIIMKQNLDMWETTFDDEGNEE